MPPLPQTRLHKLMGTSTTWSDALWHDAITYVHAQDDYTRMSMVRALVGLPWERGTTQNDCLEDFHRLPPTTMLGLYDRARWEQLTDAYRERTMDRQTEAPGAGASYDGHSSKTVKRPGAVKTST